jgi:O-antigen/teichoic acid export membrane protein
MSWSAIAQLVTQAFTFALSIVLARILGPESYGLIGMVNVLAGFASLFSEVGFGAAIVQRKDLEDRHLNSAFWANVILGFIITGILVALAPWIARWYHQPVLAPLTAAMACKFFVDSLNVVQTALLNRKINFRSQAIIQIVSVVIAGCVALVMAYFEMGPWSLVAQALGVSSFTLLLSWYLGKWTPRLHFEAKACRELLGFSSYVLGFNVVNYWARTLDQLLVGRFVGAGALGVYARAYSLMLMPLTQVSQVLGRVMFPALSTIQFDKPRVKSNYLKAISIISLVTFPMMAGLFAVSDDFVLVLLGKKWLEMIPLLRVFCLIGIIQSIGTTTGWIFLSQAKTNTYFVVGLVSSILCIISFLIGIQWGILGVVRGYLIFTILEFYPLMAITGRIIDIRFYEILKVLAPQFLCAAVMAVATEGAGMILPTWLAPWESLAVKILIGVATYLILISSFRLKAWKEAMRAFGDMSVGRLAKFKSRFQRPVVVPSK